MNTNQINGILRAVIPAAIAFCVGKGWVPAAVQDSLGGDIIAILTPVIAAGWSVQTNKTP
jgi:hypothetical protein